MPFSKGVYFFMSQTSVAAWPPAIQRRIIASAVGLSFVGSSARSCGPSRAAVPAAAPVRRKSRRVNEVNMLSKLLSSRNLVGRSRLQPDSLRSGTDRAS